MFLIYDLIFLIIALIYLPVYLFKGKFHRGMIRRLGILPEDLKLNHPIWVHAVSVGEVNTIKRLLDKLRQAYPDKNFVISTVTQTGNIIAHSIAAEGDFVTYLPFDLSFIVKKAVRVINPCLFVIAETEIWPNLITCMHNNSVPIITVNARISDSSFKGYLLVKFLVKKILNQIDILSVQTQEDAGRLLRLGVDKDKIKVTGNMKFDAVGLSESSRDYRKLLGLKNNEIFFIAASTHPKEEEIIIEAYKKLRYEYKGLRLLVAPRHPERAKEIEGIIKKSGLSFIRFPGATFPKNDIYGSPVFILDTVGVLSGLYNAADIVFVGKSLIPGGGQNILEPAYFAKPVLFGPHMFNFRKISEMFINENAAIAVKNSYELKLKIKKLLDQPNLAKQVANRARELVLRNQGATSLSLELIKQLLGAKDKKR